MSETCDEENTLLYLPCSSSLRLRYLGLYQMRERRRFEKLGCVWSCKVESLAALLIRIDVHTQGFYFTIFVFVAPRTKDTCLKGH